MPASSFPARLHILLAREAPLGLVIRRGPSKYVCTILWDRLSDTFSLGQWMKGRLYERRSDLSPDGRYLLYFASRGGGLAWTAISRAPWLKAIGFWPQSHTWLGGGLFLSRTTYWFNGEDSIEARQPPGVFASPADGLTGIGEHGAECLSVYYPRLVRDGWVRIEMPGSPPLMNGKRTAIFRKPLTHGWMLEKRACASLIRSPGRGCYFDEHALIPSDPTATPLDRTAWEWADRDGDRLVWCEGGKLCAAAIQRMGLVNERVLKDFNDMRFEPIRAPY